MQLINLVSTAVLFASALANPVNNRRCVGQGYATFYNDHSCTENGGEAVDISNPGCLNESGRNSIYIQAPCVTTHFLVWSPESDCNCQNHCEQVPGNDNDANFCWDLTGTKFNPLPSQTNSFRFQAQDCGDNNC